MGLGLTAISSIIAVHRLHLPEGLDTGLLVGGLLATVDGWGQMLGAGDAINKQQSKITKSENDNPEI